MFARVFGRPTTSNSLRHSYANSLDLQNMTHGQLQRAAKRLAHVNPDTLARLYVWGALKQAPGAAAAGAVTAQQQGAARHQSGPNTLSYKRTFRHKSR